MNKGRNELIMREVNLRKNMRKITRKNAGGTMEKIGDKLSKNVTKKMTKAVLLAGMVFMLTSCNGMGVGDIADQARGAADQARDALDRVTTFIHDSGAYDMLRQFEEDIRENTVVTLPTTEGIAEIDLSNISDAVTTANDLRSQFTEQFRRAAAGEQVKEIERSVTIDITDGYSPGHAQFNLARDLAYADVDNLIVRADNVEIGFRPPRLQQEFGMFDAIQVIVENSIGYAGEDIHGVRFEDGHGNPIKFINNVTIYIEADNIFNNSVIFDVSDGSNVLIGGRIADGKLVFQTKDGGQYVIGTNQVDFTDIGSEDRETQQAIEHLASRGVFDIMGLIEILEFMPNSTVDRADAVVMVTKTLFKYDEDHVSRFDDVPKDAWFYTAVASGKAEAIISGYPDNTFRPGNPISKTELLVIASNTLVRERQHIFPEDYRPILGDFIDEIDEWARPYVAMCIRDGIIQQDRIVNGSGAINRAEAALILYNLFTRL